jgi:signal transduction histidine kinase
MKLFQTRQAKHDYRQVFLDFNRSLHTIKDKTLLISSIVTRIYDLIPARAIYFFWENGDATRYQLVNTDTSIKQDMFLLPGDGLSQWLKLNEKLLIVSFAPEYANIFSDNDACTVKKLDTALIYPLKTSNQFRGMILMTERKDHKPYCKQDLEILSVLLDNAILAIENVTYHEEHVTHLKHIFQADRLAVIGQLAAGAAHEIRNPLTSIKSIIQYVHGDIHEPRKYNMIKTVLLEVDRINDILTGLLSFSRQTEPVKHEFDLVAMIDQTISLIRNTRNKKQIELVATYYASSIPVVADSDQMKQVMMNIILNAFDAIDGDGKVNIDVQPATFNGELFYTITITDNGKGIEEENLERLFDPFYTTKEEGTGLGLSISYGIIHRHRGNIEVVNYPNGGAQVIIQIPKGIVDNFNSY